MRDVYEYTDQIPESVSYPDKSNPSLFEGKDTITHRKDEDFDRLLVYASGYTKVPYDYSLDLEDGTYVGRIGPLNGWWVSGYGTTGC